MERTRKEATGVRIAAWIILSGVFAYDLFGVAISDVRQIALLGFALVCFSVAAILRAIAELGERK